MVALGWSHSQAETNTNTLGAPISFGAINIGGGSSRGGGGASQGIDSGGSTATSATIPTDFGSMMSSLLGGQGGTGGGWTDILPGLMNSGMGLNGNQVQDPVAGQFIKTGLNSTTSPAAASANGIPVIGIAGLAVAGVLAFMIARG